MKNLIFIAVVGTMVGIAIAEEKENPMTPEQRRAAHDKRIEERHGGYLNVRGTPSGQIVIVNAQKKIGAENFDVGKQRSSYSELTKVTKVIEGTYDAKQCLIQQMEAMKSQQKADFLMIIVDNPQLPPSIVAVEAKWAIMNVAALEKGAATAEVVRTRSRSEFLRVYALLCGGYCSQFKSQIMNGVREVADLDRCAPELPVDVGQKIVTYIGGCGVRLPRRTTYRKAVQEGWAPAPTNKFQQAIWDEIRSIPTSPIRIEKK